MFGDATSLGERGCEYQNNNWTSGGFDDGAETRGEVDVAAAILGNVEESARKLKQGRRQMKKGGSEDGDGTFNEHSILSHTSSGTSRSQSKAE